jgi:DNA-binding MarR family transcriptional regulator
VADHIYEDLRITAMGLFAEAYSGLVARLSGQLAEHDLSWVEFEVLLRLSRSPENRLRMTDLAAQTQLTTSGVTRVVDRLERDGLLCRIACPTDRRSSYAAVTRAGLARLGAVLPGHIELIDAWFTGRLSAAQLDHLMTGLRVVRDAVRPGAISGAASSRG